MALLHRALVAWFVALVFLILLVLQLDHRTQWSWFLVLVPLWFWDCLIIVIFIFHLISHGRQNQWHSRPWYFCKKALTLMSPILLKVTFQCLLCNKLDSPHSGLPWYYVFIPLWVLLNAALVKLTRVLIPICNE